MNLNANSWEEFKLGDLIQSIYKGKAINKGELSETNCLINGIRYITRTAENNGCELIADKNAIDEKFIEKGNAITIGDTTATCFYQGKEFITGDHMVIIRAEWLNENIGVFIVSLLNAEQYKYSYGRAYLMDRIKSTVIKLPIDCYGKPDWKRIEEDVKELNFKRITTKNKPNQSIELNINNWKEFLIEDVFLCETTYLSVKDDLSSGNIPFISRTAENNACDGKVSIEESKISKGNCITIGAEGIYAFYQPIDFATGNKVYTLRNEAMNSYTGMFVASILNLEDYRYSYGRARILNKLKKETIKLPVDSNGKPDWQFMENYIKSLPYGDRI